MTFPDDPVAFLQDCSAWREWLEEAHPDEIDRYPENGHIHYREASPWYQPLNAPQLIVTGLIKSSKPTKETSPPRTSSSSPS